MRKRNIIIIVISLALAAIIAVGCIYFFGYHLPDERKKAEREQQVREYYATKLALYEEENEKYDDYEVDVAFLGDSLTDGCNLATYYPQWTTANRGIGGETTHGLENRLQVSAYDLKPKVVVMLIGGNNLDSMFENYEDILVGLRDNLPQSKVVLVSLTAMGQSMAKKNQLAAYNNVVIKKLADKYGYAFVDVFTPLFNEASGEIYAEYTTDGAHLTPQGYVVLSSAITPAIEAALNN